MRGHLEARGKGIWRAKAFVGYDKEKKRRMYVTRTIHGTKRQAEDIMRQLLVEIGAGADTTTEGTVAELVKKWLEITSDSLSPTTLNEYKRLLDRHILPALGTRKVRGIKVSELDAFYARLKKSGGAQGNGLSSQSVRHIHAIIHKIFNQAVKWGWASSNPASLASPPKLKSKQVIIPSVDQVIKLIESAKLSDEGFGCLLRSAAVTGARRGELCALKWSDLDLSKRVLTISRSIAGDKNDHMVEKDTKTHSSRSVTLDSDTCKILRDWQKTCEDRAKKFNTKLVTEAFIFSDSPDSSQCWRPGRITLAFMRLCKKLEIKDVRFHDLRHFAATRMLVAGVPVKTVSGRLGHADAATTLNVYAHFVEASDAQAAQVLGDLLDQNEAI